MTLNDLKRKVSVVHASSTATIESNHFSCRNKNKRNAKGNFESSTSDFPPLQRCASKRNWFAFLFRHFDVVFAAITVSKEAVQTNQKKKYYYVCSFQKHNKYFPLRRNYREKQFPFLTTREKKKIIEKCCFL